MLHRKFVRKVGMITIGVIEDAGLFLILLATLAAAGQEISTMVEARRVTVSDLLMLFILLEVISMVEAYWRLGKLPVRMPLYIAMVALARYLILDTAETRNVHAIYVTLAILVLALAVLVVRYGHLKLPYPSTDGSPDY